MKRDFDVLRDLLLRAERLDGPIIWVSDIDADEDGEYFGYSDEVEREHFRLLKEAGFVSEVFDNQREEAAPRYGYRITWSGYEFLDTIRDDEVWAQTKTSAKAVGAFSLEIARDIAMSYIRAELRSKLGVPL